MQINKYEIVLVNLTPVKGSEQDGVRPCLVMQNNGTNRFSPTTVVCSFTSKIKDFPHNMLVDPSDVNKLKVKSCLDLLQMRTIDKIRIIKKIGHLESKYFQELRYRFMDAYDVEDLLIDVA